MSTGHTDQLFEGIVQGAQQEAITITERAKRDAEVVRASYTKKVADAIALEQRNTEKQLEQIRRKEESTLRNLERRHTVSHSERLRQAVLENVSRRMTALVGSESYRNIIVGWIAEAAIGLDRAEASVHCSFKEQVDDSMLREAEELVKEHTGRTVVLRFGGATLTAQGVEVASLDGKVAYNNQVATRLIRHERDLKELMEGKTCRKG
ncbi:MAG: hypothetical protein CVV46_15770 [Spirochaetae bacterium HGW-Spirochaetae-2]|jgi:vacuolar-type H+-ATPase subunit E/Vma4|nr:MAG: hypothetical protein CVV46_15770 [Spirochaetae bacterium HGW-Spirochaetae-2]